MAMTTMTDSLTQSVPMGHSSAPGSNQHLTPSQLPDLLRCLLLSTPDKRFQLGVAARPRFTQTDAETEDFDLDEK